MALLQSVCNGYGRRFAVKGIPFMGSLFYIYPKIAVCVLRCCGMFATHLQFVWNTFTECSQRVRYLYVTYSPCKSMVFAPQKYGFWRAKVWFLHCKSMVFVFWMLCCCKLVAIYFVFECEYLAQQIWVFCDMLVAYSWVYFLIFLCLKWFLFYKRKC